MIKIVRKWFWAWNDDKEEKFLGDMALKGYRLTRVRIGKYTFEEDEPRKIKYQLDFKGIGRMKEDEYLQIYEDAGWKCIHTLGGWYYFEKEYTDEEPDISIFNDNKSLIDKYRRIIIFPNLERTEFEFPGFYFFSG